MATVIDKEQLALEHCANEPIHVPGCVQGVGAMVVLDRYFTTITHVSANIEAFLGSPPSALLGRSTDVVFDRLFRHAARNALSRPSLKTCSEFLGCYTFGDMKLAAGLSLSGEHLILELENRDVVSDSAPLSSVQWMLHRVQDADNLEGLLQAATDVVRLTLACDRVMIYRFLASGDGEVVAESRWRHITPYLGLRYPASDIPPQARAIYFKTPMRVIFNVDGEQAPLLSLDADAAPVDMTPSVLRGVSPMHLQYLSNMGVKGSLSIPLIIDGELWGLIACHSESFPMDASPQTRSVCSLFGQMFSSLLWQYLERDLLDKRSALPNIRRALSRLNRHPDLETVFKELVEGLGQTITRDGLGLYNDGQWLRQGHCPDRDTLSALSAYSLAKGPQPVKAFDSLREILPDHDLGGVAGALILHLNTEPRVEFVLLRREVTATIRWAGAREKEIEETEDGPRLRPRASFQEYLESVQGRCEPWSVGDLQMATELRGLLLEQMLRQEWINHRRKKVLVGELNHRIKNLFSLVRSLARQTRHSTDNLDDFMKRFDARLMALTAAHDQATGFGSTGASIRVLLQTELSPFLRDGGERRVMLTGPKTVLRDDAAPMVALLIHELTTNAVKYGALSVPHGDVNIEWRLSRGGNLSLSWVESGGPPVVEPEDTGLGLDLLRRAIPYEFGGEVQIRFPETGVEAEIRLPMVAVESNSVEEPEDEELLLLSADIDLEDVDLSNHNILIVEDNILLAMDTAEQLTSMGCKNIDTAPSVERSLMLMERSAYTFALLDINLRDSNSFEIARKLKREQIPFCFISGYENTEHLDAELIDVPILTKPLKRLALHIVLAEMLSSRTRL